MIKASLKPKFLLDMYHTYPLLYTPKSGCDNKLILDFIPKRSLIEFKISKYLENDIWSTELQWGFFMIPGQLPDEYLHRSSSNWLKNEGRLVFP